MRRTTRRGGAAGAPEQRAGGRSERISELLGELWEDAIQHSQDAPLHVANAIDQVQSEASQLAQLQDQVIRHVVRPRPTDTHQIGEVERVALIGLRLPHARGTQRSRLKRIDDLDLPSVSNQVTMFPQPVMTAGFQSDRYRFAQSVQAVLQALEAGAIVRESERTPKFSTALLQETRVVSSLTHIDADRDHISLLVDLCGAIGSFPAQHKTSVVSFVIRGTGLSDPQPAH
jgi:hypothetical protein